jgi:hypothetical protein
MQEQCIMYGVFSYECYIPHFALSHQCQLPSSLLAISWGPFIRYLQSNTFDNINTIDPLQLCIGFGFPRIIYNTLVFLFSETILFVYQSPHEVHHLIC